MIEIRTCRFIERARGFLKSAITHVFNGNHEVDVERISRIADGEEVFEVDGTHSSLLKAVVLRTFKVWSDLEDDLQRLKFSSRPLKETFPDKRKPLFGKYLCNECGAPLGAESRAQSSTPIERVGTPPTLCSDHHREDWPDRPLTYPLGRSKGRSWSILEAIKAFPRKLSMEPIESLEVPASVSNDLANSTWTWVGDKPVSLGRYLVLEVEGDKFLTEVTPRIEATYYHFKEVWNDTAFEEAAQADDIDEVLPWERLVDFEERRIRETVTEEEA